MHIILKEKYKINKNIFDYYKSIELDLNNFTLLIPGYKCCFKDFIILLELYLRKCIFSIHELV